MRNLYGLLAHSCGGLAVFMLFVAAMAVPTREARAYGSSPCDNGFGDCMYALYGSCDTSMLCPLHPQECNNCYTGGITEEACAKPNSIVCTANSDTEPSDCNSRTNNARCDREDTACVC